MFIFRSINLVEDEETFTRRIAIFVRCASWLVRDALLLGIRVESLLSSVSPYGEPNMGMCLAFGGIFWRITVILLVIFFRKLAW